MKKILEISNNTITIDNNKPLKLMVFSDGLDKKLIRRELPIRNIIISKIPLKLSGDFNIYTSHKYYT